MIQTIVNPTFPLPDYTCSIIDRAKQALEEIRTANETLRSTAISYKRENEKLVKLVNETNEKMQAVEQVSKQTLLRVSEIKSLDGNSLRSKAIDLQLELDKLKDIEEILYDVAEATDCGSYKFKKRITPKAAMWIKATEKVRKDAIKQKREDALLKLSEADIKVLGINRIPASDFDDDSDGDEPQLKESA